MSLPFQIGSPSSAIYLWVNTVGNTVQNGHTVIGNPITPDYNHFGVFELTFDCASNTPDLTTQPNPHVKVFAIPINDDNTTYPNIITGAAVSTGVNVPPAYFIGSFNLLSVKTYPQKIQFVADMLKFNNRTWKLALTNNTGLAFLDTSNTKITLRTYNEVVAN